jgi:hypothetical protein
MMKVRIGLACPPQLLTLFGKLPTEPEKTVVVSGQLRFVVENMAAELLLMKEEGMTHHVRLIAAVLVVGLLMAGGLSAQHTEKAEGMMEKAEDKMEEAKAEMAEMAEPSVSIDLAYMTHLDMNLPEQDVYIEKEGMDGVWRVTKGDHDMNAPLYKSSEEVHHDPFNPDALGPHPKGDPLGLTLGEWLKHKGAGTYTCTNGEGHFKSEFSGMIPNGVYTMWHAFIALPPTTPFSGTLDLPLGARDGSESYFTADAEGKASVERRLRPGEPVRALLG